MTTPRDLFVVALDVTRGRPLEPGDLALALAGAELIDLVRSGAATLDGERIAPAGGPAPEDSLLGLAAAALRPQVPHERVEDWLWRRGRGLAGVYRDAFEAEGLLALRHRRWLPSWTGRIALVDSTTRTRAGHRWAAEDPVLVALAAAAGVSGGPTADLREITDEPVVTVLAAVDDAVTELVGARHRRSIEDAAFANVWRGA
ncbi:GPP34 family phosphoprotein [Streptomyces mangrovisoli]|uniref:GPP34 family phosphoprotein n=1 Tax=Streptomyces mangrovisoli TaxID=1428628 RepID=A0A1J4P203_9ACTN|nr:GPP34 family phosphoprotein [Streptomyces mangrovisoli]OIJ67772.1 hypothetical protein WN71_011235 [Streptomyces mangrovisoli]